MFASLNSRLKLVVPEIVRRRVGINQLTTRARMGMAMAGIGIFVAIAVASAFSDDSNLKAISFLPTIMMYIVLIITSFVWLRIKNKELRYNRYVLIFQLIQFLLGLTWSFIIFNGIATGNADQRSLIYALTIGLMSTTMISGPAKYGLAFWSPITLGAFISLGINLDTFYAPILTCLFLYGALSLYIIFEMNNRLFERELNMLVIEDKNTTIENLLREYQDGRGSILWTSDIANNIYGFDNINEFNELINREDLTIPVERIDELIHNMDHYYSSKAIRSAGISLSKLLSQKAPFNDFVFSIPSTTDLTWWQIAGKPKFAPDGSFVGFHGVATDISKKEEYRRKIEFSASRDYLTKLLNRASFNEIVDGLIHDQGGYVSALLCLDLDRFKTVNDNFGHDAGDELLVAVAQRLLASVREHDYVFRLGGDEFAIVMPDVSSAFAEVIANRIVDKLGESFQINGNEMRVGTCIGIGFLPDDGEDTFTLHRNADLALYRAKTAKSGTICIYNSDVDSTLKLTQLLLYDSNFALVRDQFEILYQPIVSIKTRDIIGCEALIRWNHPTYGVISPSVFIPIMEKSGQISQLGLWAIEKAMIDSEVIHYGLHISINISPLQLIDGSFPEKILALAHEKNVPISRFEFEITETSLLENSHEKLEVLSRIKNYGFNIALDDFGTGYSSLRLLQEFNFNKLKIDGAFIRDCTLHKQNIILDSILLLGRRLGISIVAEGVETREQEEYLVGLGCDLAQGFYYCHPTDKTSLVSLIERSRSTDKHVGLNNIPAYP